MNKICKVCGDKLHEIYGNFMTTRYRCMECDLIYHYSQIEYKYDETVDKKELVKALQLFIDLYLCKSREGSFKEFKRLLEDNDLTIDNGMRVVPNEE